MRAPHLAPRHASIALPLALAATVACSPKPRPDGGAGLLPVGAAAPDVSAPDQHGVVRRPSDERGHPLVVYFYPKDATPGCTREACAFRDAWQRFEQAGVRVWGVSTQDVASHAKFAAEHRLTFPLIADESGAWATAFGVPTRFGLATRVSFLVGPDGKVAKVYPNVDPAVHAEEVLRDAAATTGAK